MDLPPPAYDQAVGGFSYVDQSKNRGLSFVDFYPDCLDPGSIFSHPHFEPFSALIAKANGWLAQNPVWEAKTCESVEFPYRLSSKLTKMTFTTRNNYRECYIRGLRLWLILRIDPSERPQQIGCYTMVPEMLDGGGWFTCAKYESLNDMLSRSNATMRYNPLPGRILTIETQEMVLKENKSFDPDISWWVDFHRCFVCVVRVFYEVGNPQCTEIGLADFLPDQVSEPGFLRLPSFAPFSTVVAKAAQWCTQQRGVHFCHAQSFGVKLSQNYVIDTQKMCYRESGVARTYYIKILRVAYTKMSEDEVPATKEPLTLTCKTFMPVLLASGLTMKFEDLYQTRARVEAWIKATGASVLSAETVVMNLKTREGLAEVPERIKFYRTPHQQQNQNTIHSAYVLFFRLYFNGYYPEPDSRLLPPVPEAEKGCAIF